MTAFSQKSTISDTTVITITKATAKEIIKDLIRKDLLEQESSLLQSTNSLLVKSHVAKDSLLAIKDSTISLHTKKEIALNEIIAVQKLQIYEYDKIKQLSIDLIKENKSLKKVNKTQKIFGTVFIGLISILAVIR